jgi:hypothetical protein
MKDLECSNSSNKIEKEQKLANKKQKKKTGNKSQKSESLQRRIKADSKALCLLPFKGGIVNLNGFFRGK